MFPYHRHFDGYVKMSEEDAALFWEMDDQLTPGPENDSMEPRQADGTVPVMKEIIPENTTVTRPVPSDWPEDLQCTGVGNRPVSDSQDTKPADSARRARLQERTGVPADDTVTLGTPCLQASKGTQTEEIIPTRIETLEENGGSGRSRTI